MAQNCGHFFIPSAKQRKYKKHASYTQPISCASTKYKRRAWMVARWVSSRWVLASWVVFTCHVLTKPAGQTSPHQFGRQPARFGGQLVRFRDHPTRLCKGRTYGLRLLEIFNMFHKFSKFAAVSNVKCSHEKRDLRQKMSVHLFVRGVFITEALCRFLLNFITAWSLGLQYVQARTCSST